MPWALLTNRYVLIACAFVLTLLYAGCEHKRAEHWKEKYTTFEIQVRALGEQARKVAQEKEARDERTRKIINEEHQATVDRLNAAVSKLRQRGSSGGASAPAPQGSRCPTEQVCFDRAEYQRAIGEFDSEARRLVDEGSAVAIELETVRKWWGEVSR